MTTAWQKQSPDKPLFPDLIWSRPENKRSAGKLLIIGGNLHGLSAPAEAYGEALKAGVGQARVLLPDAVKKLVGPVMEHGEFAPSTPSGSFNRQALNELLEHSEWADGVLLAGELGRNSETAITLESFVQKYSGQLTVTRDAVDYFLSSPEKLLNRPDTTLVLGMSQLQKLYTTKAITFGMDLLRLADALAELTNNQPINIVVKHLDNIFVAASGQVSVTAVPTDLKIWRVKTATHTSVWWLQNPTKTFEALTTAIYESLK